MEKFHLKLAYSHHNHFSRSSEENVGNSWLKLIASSYQTVKLQAHFHNKFLSKSKRMNIYYNTSEREAFILLTFSSSANPPAAKSAVTVLDPSCAAFIRQYFTTSKCGKTKAYSNMQMKTKNAEIKKKVTAQGMDHTKFQNFFVLQIIEIDNAKEICQYSNAYIPHPSISEVLL